MESWKQILQKQKRWQKEKEIIKIKNRIKKQKKALSNFKISTSKIFTFLLFLNCSCIQFFAAWATVQSINIAKQAGTMIDFSPLVALIGAVVGESIGFWIYAAKAKAQNTAGGLTYEMAMAAAKDKEDFILQNEQEG